jgi:hypothetical protein
MPISGADFGFAKSFTYRYLIDRVTQGAILVYPSRDLSPESNEGPGFSIRMRRA